MIRSRQFSSTFPLFGARHAVFAAGVNLLAMTSLAGCVNECPTERTLVWNDPDLLQAVSESDGLAPVGFEDQLAVSGAAMAEPWRLVFVRQYGDGWVIHFLAALGEPRLLLNIESSNATPPTTAQVGEFVTTLTGWNRSQAQAWADQHPLEEGVGVPFDHPVQNPGIQNPYVPKNGFWRFVDVEKVRYEWATPHFEVGTDEQHLAVGQDGRVAWWGIIGGPRPEQAAREKAAAFLRDHGADGGPPAKATYYGAEDC